MPCRRIHILVLCALALVSLQAQADTTAVDLPSGGAVAQSRPTNAQFGTERPTPVARSVADWVVHSGDNQEMPFIILDKKAAHAFLFDHAGQLLGATPVLLGSAIGDDSAPGIGDRKLADILPHERTTPAGRFVSSLALNLQGEDILWVDYGTAISLHRVVTANAKERRAQRLATPTPADNRISYGCINVSAMFFEKLLVPAFKESSGVVYVLPELKSAADVFGLPGAAGVTALAPG